MNIINLTQHPATEEQRRAGVVDPGSDRRNLIGRLLTFHDVPTPKDLDDAVAGLVAEINRINATVPVSGVMIGGAPFLMPRLEKGLKDAGYDPMYSFSRRESVESVRDDGTVEKRSVFRHMGFVKA